MKIKLLIIMIFLVIVRAGTNAQAFDHAEIASFSGPLPLYSDSINNHKVFEGKGEDLCDLYTFLSGENLVLIMTALPLQPPTRMVDPSNFEKYVFNPNVAYEFHIDNNEDLVADHVIEFRFSKTNVDFRQFVVVTGIPGIPELEGEINTPKYPSPIRNVASSNGVVRVFAGPRDDPAYLDLVGFRNGMKFGYGDFAGGTNVSAIVIEMPLSLVRGQGKILQTWAVTLK